MCCYAAPPSEQNNSHLHQISGDYKNQESIRSGLANYQRSSEEGMGQSLDPNLRILPAMYISFCPKCMWLWGPGKELSTQAEVGGGVTEEDFFVRKPHPC